MSYNNFTIDYIEIVKSTLCIEVNDNNEPICIPWKISNSCLLKLKDKLNKLWDLSNTAICIVTNKKYSKIQAGLFGQIDNLDFALKVGYLTADRIVLIDYLFSRFLSRNKPENIDRIQLCRLCNSLVSLLPLAKKGRIVIIPNPFHWNFDTKSIIQEASKTTTLTIPLISMLNMLSICKECRLHPFTVAESLDVYDNILNNQIDHTGLIGKTYGRSAYDGIINSLLSEKLLNNVEFKFIQDYPIEEYFKVIEQEEGFYSDYLSKIMAGGINNSEYNIENLAQSFLDSIKKKNDKLSSFAKKISVISGIGGAGITLLGTTSVISAPLAITGATMTLLSTLGALMNSKVEQETPFISVFKGLLKNNI